MTQAFYLLFALIAAHFLCDYPLQGDFLARAKNHREPIPHVPWYQAMTAHATIHAAAVYLVLGIWWLAALEFVAHFAIDHYKCSGELTFNEDQLLHLACKIAWIAAFLLLV